MCIMLIAARDAFAEAACLGAAARSTAFTAAILPRFLTDIIKCLFDCKTFTASLWLMLVKSIPLTLSKASPCFNPACSAADPLSTVVMIRGWVVPPLIRTPIFPSSTCILTVLDSATLAGATSIVSITLPSLLRLDVLATEGAREDRSMPAACGLLLWPLTSLARPLASLACW